MNIWQNWQQILGAFATGIGLGALVEFALRKVIDKSIDNWFQTRKSKNDLLNERLFIIYGKLKHDMMGITISSARLAIPLKTRFSMAFKALKEKGVKSGWAILIKNYNQKGLTDSFEYENFTGFDLEGAREHIKKHRKYADYRLIEKLDAAVRAEREVQIMEAMERSVNKKFVTYGQIVTPQTYELISYIDKQYKRLSKKLEPQ